MLLGRTEADAIYDFSKNQAIGTGGSAEQPLSKVEKRISGFQLTSVQPPAPPGIGAMRASPEERNRISQTSPEGRQVSGLASRGFP